MGLPLMLRVELEIESAIALTIDQPDVKVDDFRGYSCRYRLDDETRWRGFTLEAPAESLLGATVAALAAINSEAATRAA
jgi:hypothetical protein